MGLSCPHHHLLPSGPVESVGCSRWAQLCPRRGESGGVGWEVAAEQGQPTEEDLLRTEGSLRDFKDGLYNFQTVNLKHAMKGEGRKVREGRPTSTLSQSRLGLSGVAPESGQGFHGKAVSQEPTATEGASGAKEKHRWSTLRWAVPPSARASNCQGALPCSKCLGFLPLSSSLNK